MTGPATPRRRRSQRDRVLAALIARPERGITQYDFCLGRTAIDGGPPISRLASRISDLRAHAWDIQDSGWRDGLKVYRLAVPTDPHLPRADVGS